MNRRPTQTIAGLALLLAVACGCSSTSTGQPAAAPSSSALQRPSTSASVSVPADVPKDSVLDLNSTKDMTGIETTVPANQSPYIDYLPDICPLITPQVMQRLDMKTKVRGFNAKRLVVQACALRNRTDGAFKHSVTINFFVKNISELTNPKNLIQQRLPVMLDSDIRGRVVRLPKSGPDSTTFNNTCSTVWGTFFGSVGIDYEVADAARQDPCDASVAAAKILAPLVPKSPSQMRATR